MIFFQLGIIECGFIIYSMLFISSYYTFDHSLTLWLLDGKISHTLPQKSLASLAILVFGGPSWLPYTKFLYSSQVLFFSARYNTCFKHPRYRYLIILIITTGLLQGFKVKVDKKSILFWTLIGGRLKLPSQIHLKIWASFPLIKPYNRCNLFHDQMFSLKVIRPESFSWNKEENTHS